MVMPRTWRRRLHSYLVEANCDDQKIVEIVLKRDRKSFLCPTCAQASVGQHDWNAISALDVFTYDAVLAFARRLR